MSRVYSNLASVERLQSGIGDNNDLKVIIKEDLDGRWYPAIHKGDYYFGTEREYLFAKETVATSSVGISGSIHTSIVSNLAEDPSKYGPIIVKISSRTAPLTRVCSPLRAFRKTYVNGTGDLRNASATGLLVFLCSDPVTGVMHTVAASGDFVSNEDYVYSKLENKLYFPPNTPDNVWCTYLVGDGDSDILRQEEIHRVDKDGRIRVQLKDVCNAQGFTPLIRKPKATGLQIVVATVASGNVLTPHVSGGISSGDIVSVQYYVDNSYAAIVSGSMLVLKILPSATGTVSTYYEQSIYPWHHLSDYSSGSVYNTIRRYDLNQVHGPIAATGGIGLESSGAVFGGNGSNIFLRINGPEAREWAAQSGCIYVRAWVKILNPGSNAFIIRKGTSINNRRQWELRYGSAAKTFSFYPSLDGTLGASTIAATTTGVIVSGTYYSIEGWFDFAERRARVRLNNGPTIQAASTTKMANFDEDVSCLGYYTEGGNAVLDSLEVRTMQPSDTLAGVIYNSGVPLKFNALSDAQKTGLIAYYDFDETSGTRYNSYQPVSGYVIETHSNLIQLNPLYDNVGSGFLYLKDKDTADYPASKIDVRVSNYNPSFNTSGLAKFIVVAQALDVENNPVGRTGMFLSAIPGVMGMTKVYPQNTYVSDKFGVSVWSGTLSSSGLTSAAKIMVYASGGVSSVEDISPVSGAAFILPSSTGLLRSLDEIRLGKLLLSLESNEYLEGKYKLSAAYVYPDGTPFQPHEEVDFWDTGVVFSCNRSKLYDLKGNPITNPSIIPIDSDSIATILIEPTPGDIIRAQVQTPSTLRKVSASPILIPSKEDN